MPTRPPRSCTCRSAQVDSVAVLAALLSVDQHALVDELELYNEVVLGQEQDPFGKTSFPPGGARCWGCGCGCRGFCCCWPAAGACVVDGSRMHCAPCTARPPASKACLSSHADVFFGGEMYAAEVTPVVHYTMGGIEIDASGGSSSP